MSVSVTTVIRLKYLWVNTSFISGKLSRIKVEKIRLIILKCQKLKLSYDAMF